MIPLHVVFPTQENTNTKIGKKKTYKKRQRQNVMAAFWNMWVQSLSMSPVLASLLKCKPMLIYVRLFVLSNSSPTKHTLHHMIPIRLCRSMKMMLLLLFILELN